MLEAGVVSNKNTVFILKYLIYILVHCICIHKGHGGAVG